MSRRIIGYQDGRAIWEDLGPTENVQWGHALGGRAIEERVIPRPSEPTSVKHLQQKIRRLRGANLFDENGAWKK